MLCRSTCRAAAPAPDRSAALGGRKTPARPGFSLTGVCWHDSVAHTRRVIKPPHVRLKVMHMSNQRGFTLVELMIVVAIVAILAAVALPAFRVYVARAQVTEALSLSSGLSRAVLESYWQTGACVQSGNGVVPPATDVNGPYVLSVEASGTGTPTGGCTMTVTLRSSNVSPSLQGKTLTLTLDTAGSSSRWLCTSTVEQRYLPTSCTGT